jgi:hypothetical protein
MMKHGLRFLTVLFAFVALADANAQRRGFEWLVAPGGGLDDYVYDIWVDDADNVYLAGKLKSTPLNFGNGVSISTIGNNDAFVAKYAPDSVASWAVADGSPGSASSDEARAVCVDQYGNVYFAGGYFGTAYFGDDTATSTDNWDIFVAKYDASGNYIGMFEGKGQKQCKANELLVTSDDHLLIGGYFGGTDVDTVNFNGVSITGAGNRDGLIVKTDLDGNVVWTQTAGSPSPSEEVKTMALDGAEDVYITGVYQSVAILGDDTLTAIGGREAYVAKLDGATGDYLWARTVGERFTDVPYDVAVNDSVVVIVGEFYDTLEVEGREIYSAGQEDMFVVIYDLDGTLDTAFVFGSELEDEARAVALDDSLIYVGGYVKGEVVTGDSIPMGGSGSRDGVLIVFKDNAPHWGQSIEGSLDNAIYDVAFGSQGQIYLAGYITGTANYDLESVRAVGSRHDMFLARLGDRIVPVELSLFDAAFAEGEVTLRWRTESESNSRGFEIERALGDDAFRKIGFVEAAGVSNVPREYRFADKPNATGVARYRLKQVDLDGAFAYSETIEVELSAPIEFALERNYPNPFNAATVFQFSLPEAANVELAIYNALGERAATATDKAYEAGMYRVTFDASALASGVYFYELRAVSADGFERRATGKAVLLK